MLKPPAIERINRILLFTILISLILYFGREFFVLITFSGFFAMLMTPVSNKLEYYKVSRVFSSLVSVLIIVVVISAVGMLLSAQVGNIGKELPLIISRFEQVSSGIQSWITDSLGISSEQLKDHTSGTLINAGSFLKGVVKDVFTLTGSLILVLVFTFLFLLQRAKYENFVVMLYKDEKRDQAKEMIDKVSKIARQYLAGRLIAAFIIGILYLIGFSIIGLRNSVLLSAIVVVLSVIPYVGALIGGLVPFFISFIDGPPNQSLWVVVIILLVNVINHYFIEPYVVGGSVNIGPFFTIFILILGGVVWGIAGIILFLPLLGILKIVIENVEGLQPYAYLIGDQRDSSPHEKIWLKIKELLSRRKKRE
jgi:predicted PurR-regulated permease PerM